MLYVLIIMSWFSSSAGMRVTTQEFVGVESCETAKSTLLELSKNWSIYDNRLRAFCVAK